MNGFVGEFFGTMILVALGTGCGAAINLKKNYAHGQNWLFVCMAWAMAVTMGVYVASTLGSKAALNPAVAIGMAVLHQLPLHSVIPYIIAELLGAFVGAALVILHYYPQFKATKDPNENKVGIFATAPAIPNPLFNFLSETIATFFFLLILFNLGNFTTGLKPLLVGLLIGAIGMSFGGTTGFALNPARDFAPRLAYAILPVPNKGNANWSYAWVPILGPIAGSLLAAAVTLLF